MGGFVKCFGFFFFSNFVGEKWTVWPHGRFLHAVTRGHLFPNSRGNYHILKNCSVLAAACYRRLACVKAVIKLFCPAARELSEPTGLFISFFQNINTKRVHALFAQPALSVTCFLTLILAKKGFFCCVDTQTLSGLPSVPTSQAVLAPLRPGTQSMAVRLLSPSLSDSQQEAAPAPTSIGPHKTLSGDETGGSLQVRGGQNASSSFHVM